MFNDLKERIESLGICDECGIVLEALINNPNLTDEELIELAE